MPLVERGRDVGVRWYGPHVRSLGAFAGGAVLVGAVLVGACVTPARERPPLGVMPSAVTTAKPEWLPAGLRGGSAFEAHPRERELVGLRRLTAGWTVERIALTADERAIVIVGRAPGAADRGLHVLDIATGQTRTVDVGAGSLADASVRVRERTTEVLALLDDASGTRRGIEGTLHGAGLEETRAIELPAGVEHAVRGEDGRLFAIARPGGSPRTLTIDGVEVSIAVSARDFALDRDDLALVVADRLVRTSVEGRGRQELASGLLDARPTSLRDGLVFFSSRHDVERGEIYAVRLGGSARPRRLTFAGGSSAIATRDGRWLAFVSGRAGGSDVFAARWIHNDPGGEPPQ